MRGGSFRVRTRHAALQLSLVVAATAAAGLAPFRSADAATCSPSAVACDNFGRTVSNGWGIADVGGAWSASGSAYSVSNGSGNIVASSSSPTNLLTSVSVRDVDMTALITPPPINGQVRDNGLIVRYHASAWYQVNAYYGSTSNGGNYTVQLKRKPDNVLIRPEYPTNIPGGTPYRVRLEAQGVNPTILRWKLWPNGSGEPASWTDVGLDGTASQQTAGGVGVIAYVNSGTSTVGFSGLQAVPLSAAPQITSCPPSPAACDTYNRTVSNGWGSADTGGAWSASGTSWAVTPGSGTVVADSTTPANFLTGVSIQDVDVRTKISPPVSNSSQYVADAVAVRYASGSWYQVSAYASTHANSGNYVVQLTRKPDNTAVRPDYSTSLAGGIPFWFRLQAQGINPTTLRWKLWADGTAEPTAWTDTAVDSNAAQQVSGGVGVLAYASSGTSTIAFNSLQATAPTSTTAHVVACPSSPIACDSFNRTVGGGWGSADVGGAWGSTGTQWSVVPGSGSVIADSTTPTNFLGGVSAQDVDFLAMVTPPPNNSSQYVSIGVDVRSAGGSYYQVAAYDNTASNNGNYIVQVTSKPSNTTIRPDYQTSVPGGAAFWMRVEAQGVNPTTLRWRLWADGSTEPQAWNDAAVDSTTGLQGPGGVGIAAYASSGSASVSFNSVQVIAPSASKPQVIPCPTSTLACDSFNRTTANGWGRADIGGSWGATGSAFSVTPGNGSVLGDSTSPLNTFSSLSQQDVDMLALIAPPPINSSQYQDDGVVVRYAAGGTWYQVNAFFNTGNNGGDYTVQLKRKPDDTLLRPEYQTAIAGGAPYWIRLDAQGINPTTLSWKMWAVGTSEPASWTDTGTDGTAAEQAAGSAGVIAYASSGTSTVTFRSVQVSAAAPPPPPPVVTCPMSPAACDTFNRTVSGGWGSADTGGGWTIVGSAANWNVSPGAGRVNVAPSSAEIGALSSVSVRDVEILTKVVLPRSTQSNNDLAYVLARYTGGGPPTYYRVGVGQGAGAQVIIRAERSDGVTLSADAGTGIPAGDGAVVWLRVQVQGTYPTAIRARAWMIGSAEPTGSWMVDATDSTPAEQVAGAVGVRDRNEDTSSSHSFQHEAFQAVAMSAVSYTCPFLGFACDTFQRTVSNGWGSANLGGPWRSTGTKYSVVPGRATLIGDPTAPQNFLTPLFGMQDVDARVWLSMPSIGATGDGGIAVRYKSSTGTYYQVSVYYPSGRNGSDYVVQLKRKPDNVLIKPDFSINIPGGTAVWIRLQAQGVNPTTLRWKVWQDGVAEPTSWTATGTDSTAAEQGAGGVGVEGYMSSGTASIVFNYFSAGPITS